MKAIAPSWPSRPSAAGFSLVEIMVALVIGLVSVLATTQLFLISEGQKRTITGGGDAQMNGAFALYSLQRDIRQGGYGVSAFNLLGCKVTLRTGVDLSEMAPVSINPKLSDHTTPAIPEGDANTDTLLVVYGDGNGASEGNGIVSATSPNYTLQTPTAFLPNDRVIALPQSRPDPCALLLGTVSAVSASTVSVANWANNMANGTLFNLGRAPKILAYAIRGGNLTVCDYAANNCGDSNNKDDATVWVPIVSSIVSLRAEYGRDTNDPMDTIVDVYDHTAVPANRCDWARISSVRIAVVARSDQYEKSVPGPEGEETFVTLEAPTWPDPDSNLIDLSAISHWQNYRYKVFETVIPIRNIILLGAQTGC